MTIDLVSQSIKCGNTECFFAIEEHRKEILIEGLDDIEKVLKLSNENSIV